MPDKKLTDQQELFLQALFSDECRGNVRKAMTSAGYSETTAPSKVLASVDEEILKRANSFLVHNSPKALFALLDAMVNSADAGVANKIKAAESILNRVGLKDKDEPAKQESSGIVILPAKGTRITVSAEQDPDESDSTES